jgi:hypothetical protein
MVTEKDSHREAVARREKRRQEHLVAQGTLKALGSKLDAAPPEVRAAVLVLAFVAPRSAGNTYFEGIFNRLTGVLEFQEPLVEAARGVLSTWIRGRKT